MAIKITLYHDVLTTDRGTVKLILQTRAEDISSNVFAIEVIPKSADVATPIYRFSHICSPAELVEFPEDLPADNCYFRACDIEMIFDNKRLAHATLQTIIGDIKALVTEYKGLGEAEPDSGTVHFQ